MKSRILKFALICSLVIMISIAAFQVVKQNNEIGPDFNIREEPLSSKVKIIVGDDINYPPYSFIDKDGQPTGFNIDLAKAALEAMGYGAEFRLGNWNEIRRELENGNIQMISGMFYTKDREELYDFSTRLTISSGDVFTRNTTRINDIRELEGQRVVVQENDIVHEFLIEQNLNIQFIPVATVAEALRLVSTGQYDYAAVLTVPGYYIMEEMNLNNLRANKVVIGHFDYSMAVLNGNEDLLAMINGGLKVIKATGEYQAIHDKWLGIFEQKKFINELMDFLWILIVVITFVALLLIWNFTLRKMVTKRTKDLLKLNRELSESREEILTSNEEIQASMEQLAAAEEELRIQYEALREKERKLTESEARNRSIVEAIPDMLCIVDNVGTIIDCHSKKVVYYLVLLLPSSVKLCGRYYQRVFLIKGLKKLKSA